MEMSLDFVVFDYKPDIQYVTPLTGLETIAVRLQLRNIHIYNLFKLYTVSLQQCGANFIDWNYFSSRLDDFLVYLHVISEQNHASHFPLLPVFLLS